MRSRLRFPVLAVVLPALVLLAAACGGDDSDVDAGSDDTEPQARPLVGRTFVSESVTEDGQPRPLVASTQIEITFREEGTIGATAGCNHLAADVEIGADRLEVADEMQSTLMGCGQALHDQDEWLGAFLQADPSYELDGDRLTLESDGTVIELVDQESTTPTAPTDTTVPPETVTVPEPTMPPDPAPEPAPPWEGAVWELEGIISGDSIATLIEGTGATFVFRDGRVEVQVRNCNQGSATVTIGTAEMEFGPLAMTRMGCQPDAADVESAVTTTLQGTVAYTLQGSLLTLTQQSGMGLMLRGATP